MSDEPTRSPDQEPVASHNSQPPSLNPLRIDIAGFEALGSYVALPGRVLSRSSEELDRISLEKLWHTGFDVPSLDEAHDKYRISPLRCVEDIWKLLGHLKMPVNAKGGRRFTEDCLTSLAIQYPNLLDKGEVYPHTKIIRIRYPRPISTIRGKGKGGPNVESRRYDQPLNQSEERSSSEPYFLFRAEVWDRLYDPSLPLLITEGEMKGAALGLAGFAAIAFPGVAMWTAPKKSGKRKLHPALDPDGPRKSWAIPVRGRDIVLIPDVDFCENLQVADSFRKLAQALIRVGAARVRMVQMPSPPRPMLWKGIDDYLTHALRPRWAGRTDLVDQANEMVRELIEANSEAIREVWIP
jgi:hypothetical protein